MSKLVIAMVHPKMFRIANIDQTIVTMPTIRVYDTIKRYFTENNALQGLFLAVKNYLVVETTLPRKEIKNGLFQRVMMPL